MLWPKLARALFAKPLTDEAPLLPRETIQALGERLAATSRARLGGALQSGKWIAVPAMAANWK